MVYRILLHDMTPARPRHTVPGVHDGVDRCNSQLRCQEWLVLPQHGCGGRHRIPSAASAAPTWRRLQ